MAEAPAPEEARRFPIVGIGASAGGLKAFEDFFSSLKDQSAPGMAFVLVQHLAPNYPSVLPELIKRFTPMPVFEVTDGMLVQPNCIYVLPPDRDMALLGGALHLQQPVAPHGQRLPIDFFFRSLAQDQHEYAIGIVLSGTGSDGTLGVRAIKGEGGLVIAQKLESAEFDGMPRSAIATGLVDYELLPAEMLSRLLTYIADIFRKPHLPAASSAPSGDNDLKKIFILLRGRTGHDFSQYKPSTVNRRIERRMAVHNIDVLADYVKYLQQTPAEVDELFRDLLISVTSFFRDPDAFAELERIIPELFSGKRPDEKVRVWVPGCASGEEAYSIAILLLEHMETLEHSYDLQVFATDIDSRAINVARAGLYPTNIVADLSKTRLERNFLLEPGLDAYRIRKHVRDALIFSEQDLIRDPPFSNLDLISCRNVLIYMSRELQRRVFPVFHYALRPGGILFLGSSEAASEFEDLFAALDAKGKLYRRQGRAPGESPGRLGTLSLPPAPHEQAVRQVVGPAAGRPEPAPTPREQAERALLQLLAPSCALVSGNGDVLYLHGRTGMYLEPTPGEPGVNNILRMAREGLLRDLQSALNQAVANKKTVRCPGLRVKTNGHFTVVNLTVCPVPVASAGASRSDQYLIVLEDVPDADPAKLLPPVADEKTPEQDVDARIVALREELRAKEEFLRSVNDQLESSSEELKSANEEMQSVNEELQSSNEELATSKEEMQSLNEELATVNTELNSKVGELSRAVDDMNNLLSGTGIATVFVDLQQRILRFTPSITQIISLVASDVGRPVGHFVANLVSDQPLTDDVKSVLDTLIPKEHNVQTRQGRWLTMRILPYRTVHNVIEGAVITFVDITDMIKAYVKLDELTKAHAALQEVEQRYHSAVLALSEGVILHRRDGQILTWNPAAEHILGLTSAEMPQRNLLDPDWRMTREDGRPFPAEMRPSQTVVRTGLAQKDVLMGIDRPDGARSWISVSAVPIFAAGESAPATVVVSFSDMTEDKRLEEALAAAKAQARLAIVVRDTHDAITMQGLDGRILAWNPGAVRMYGWSEEEALKMKIIDRIPPQERQNALLRMTALSQAKTLEPYRTQRLTKTGRAVDVEITASALLDESGLVYAISTTERLTEADSHAG